MQVKLAAIDLDGTLLRDDMTISDYSKNVIQKIAKQGVHIVIATGRMFDSAQEKANQLALGDIPLICYTGAWIMFSQSGRALIQEGITAETTKKFLLLQEKIIGWRILFIMIKFICRHRIRRRKSIKNTEVKK